MYALAQLDAWGGVVAAVVAILAVLAPFLNRFKGLSTIQFGHPGVFTAFAEFSTLTGFLAVIYYRNVLPSIAPFWVWIVAGLLVGLGLLWLAERTKNNLQPRHVACGGLLYLSFIGLVFLGIAQGSAELVMFRQINGYVTHKDGREVGRVPVLLVVEGTSRVVETRTKNSGRYCFFLTEDEYRKATEIRIGSMSSSATSLPLIGSDQCVPTARVCYVPTIELL